MNLKEHLKFKLLNEQNKKKQELKELHGQVQKNAISWKHSCNLQAELQQCERTCDKN